MLDGTQSGCINHPGVEAAVRCKQCSKPVCNSCVVQGPTGRFCSEACKEKHQAFTQQAQHTGGRAGGGLFVKLKGLVGAVVILAVVLAVVVFVATKIEIPVLSDIAWQVRDLLGI